MLGISWKTLEYSSKRLSIVRSSILLGAAEINAHYPFPGIAVVSSSETIDWSCGVRRSIMLASSHVRSALRGDMSDQPYRRVSMDSASDRVVLTSRDERREYSTLDTGSYGRTHGTVRSRVVSVWDVCEESFGSILCTKVLESKGTPLTPCNPVRNPLLVLVLLLVGHTPHTSPNLRMS